MVLRNFEDDDDALEQNPSELSANVSGLDTFSLEEVGFYSPKMRRRRGRISHLHATSTISNETNDERRTNFILRKSRTTATGPSSSASSNGMHEGEVSKRERPCIKNDGWLHNGWYSYSSSRSPSSTSLSSFLDNLDWPIFVLVLTLVFTVSDACSTRPSPKPRPPRPIWTPDLGPNVLKENCTDDYAELYCMNAGKCYRQKILETFIVNCECQPGFVGTRCQYRDVPDKYLPVQQRIETASIAGGVTVLIIIVTVFSLLAWLYFKRRRVSGSSSSAGHV